VRLGEVLTVAETTGLPYSIDATGPKAKHAPKPENRRRRIDAYAVAAIRLLMLTGARLREMLDAKWEYIDFDRGMIFLPDSKTGRKPIYLSAAAAAILSALPRVDGNPYLFPGEKKGQPRADLKRPWDAISEAVELDGVRLHDLRHSSLQLAPGHRWDCRSSGSCSATGRFPPRSATRTLAPTP
jgi:integrase